MNCAVRVVFVRVRIAEVHQEAISQILGDVPGKLLDHRGTGGLIRTHDLAKVFGVELAGKSRRVDQITEQHRELAAFSLEAVKRRSGRRSESVVCFERWGLLSWAEARRRTFWSWTRVAEPHKTTSRLLPHRVVGVEEFRREVSEGRIIQMELALERPVRDSTPLTEEGQDLIDQAVEVHHVHWIRTSPQT
jgi:hypothetical protein